MMFLGPSSSLRTSGPLKWSEHEPAWLFGLSLTRQACVNTVSRDPPGARLRNPAAGTPTPAHDEPLTRVGLRGRAEEIE